MDYLHMQLRLRKMNEEHVASSEMRERERYDRSFLTQTPGSENSQEDVILEGDTNAVQTVYPSLIGFSSPFKMCLEATRA